MKKQLGNQLWRIYNRPDVPRPWQYGGNLPWDDAAFSARMLREHLDESHGAASRQAAEREAQLSWLWQKLELQSGATLLDVACGPGLYAVPLAQRGVRVTGIDFGPAAIEYARELAAEGEVDGRCQFIQTDIREMEISGSDFDTALLLYGQLAVMQRHEAQSVLTRIASGLRSGGRLCVELLNQEKVDKKRSSWWYTDDTGLWGDAPFLHLGERFWMAETATSVERFHILHLETGQLDQIELCDQTYGADEMVGMMKAAGFTAVNVYHAWDKLPLYDADEWVIYIATL